jgi:hypothetical protein
MLWHVEKKLMKFQRIDTRRTTEKTEENRIIVVFTRSSSTSNGTRYVPGTCSSISTAILEK